MMDYRKNYQLAYREIRAYSHNGYRVPFHIMDILIGKYGHEVASKAYDSYTAIFYFRKYGRG